MAPSTQTTEALSARAGTVLGVASFLAFGALLVLYGANSSQLIAALDLDYADLGLLGSMLSLGLGGGIVLGGQLHLGPGGNAGAFASLPVAGAGGGMPEPGSAEPINNHVFHLGG